MKNFPKERTRSMDKLPPGLKIYLETEKGLTSKLKGPRVKVNKLIRAISHKLLTGLDVENSQRMLANILKLPERSMIQAQ